MPPERDGCKAGHVTTGRDARFDVGCMMGKGKGRERERERREGRQKRGERDRGGERQRNGEIQILSYRGGDTKIETQKGRYTQRKREGERGRKRERERERKEIKAHVLAPNMRWVQGGARHHWKGCGV